MKKVKYLLQRHIPTPCMIYSDEEFDTDKVDGCQDGCWKFNPLVCWIKWVKYKIREKVENEDHLY